jgi:hypothetical protein
MPPAATRRNHRSEASVFDTLRSLVLNSHPKFADLVRRRFPRGPDGEEAFAYALELFLQVIPHLDASLDGWKMFRLASETATSLRAVGIMYALPRGVLPVEITLWTGSRGIRYRVQIGVGDSQWESLSDSKRWEAVYLYASGERDENWAWSKSITGCLG